MVVEGYTSSSFAQYQEGVGTLRSNGGDLGGGSETLIAEPYVKSRRAQSATDDETWVPGEVNPTLNSFDVGDTRATTAIIEPVMLNYQGSKGNSVTSEDGISFSLNAMHGHDVHVVTEEPILVDGRRMNDVRVYNPPVQTLGARMGTGGNNVPVIGFSHTQGLSAQPSEDAFLTLRTEGNGMAVAIPIDTRNALRDPEKYDAQNRQGLGIGQDGDPMATLTSTHVNAVAYGIQGNVIGRQPDNGLIGKGHTEEGDPMFTLTGTDVHAVAYDEYNDSINETHHALRAGTKQSTGVLEPTMAVRRLTPLECERLMGWPDDHTRYKADGTEQADTHRYKQCGNGVASPVAEWIGKQLMKLDEAPQ
jgi:DNA (cytosine-5)-methyltransferase 1